MDLTPNITDTALVFEGGGMRGAYSAAVVTGLLEAGLHFSHVCGISAGGSHTANYLSRAPERARRSFVDFAADPRFGSWRTWLQGKGLFNAEYIYQQCWLPGGPLPFDFATFQANPATFSIGAFDAVAGQTVYWGRDQVQRPIDLMVRIRASSTIPIVMPPVTLGGRLWYDGALGTNGGIPLDAAQTAGFRRFFVVLSRQRSYVKPPAHGRTALAWKFRRYPDVVDGIMDRPANYNRVRQELFDLEAAGQAYVFCPGQVTLTNHTTDVAQLQAAYDQALAQAKAELPRWRDFLGR